MRKKLYILILFCSLAICYGNGFQLYGESAADSLGRAGTGVAGPASASSSWYNNALATDLKQTEISAGISIMKLSSTYDGLYTRDQMEDDHRYCGYFYGVMPLNELTAFTLSVNAPFGMVTSWGPDSELSDLATYTSIRVCYISPGLAGKVTDTLSLGAGLNLAIGTSRLAQEITVPGDRHFNKLYMGAEGYGVGYFLSMAWKPLDDWSFGAHYQSRVRVELKGNSSYRWNNDACFPYFEDANCKTTLDLPAYAVLGVTNSTFKNWRFLFDASWTQWDSYETLIIHFNKYPGTEIRADSRTPENWHNVWSYHWGVEYLLTDKWILRGGYCYDISPCNDQTRSPEMPDNDKHVFSAGIGYQGERWGMDIAYAYAYFESCKLGTEAAADSYLGHRGDFDTDCHIVTVQTTYRF